MDLANILFSSNQNEDLTNKHGDLANQKNINTF